LILIVDDSAANIKVAHEILRDQYRTRVATSGALALKAVQATPAPDLILLDVMMPEMDGFSLAREIRKNTPQVPFIFLTAKTLKADVVEGYKIGADDYITKPFEPREILARVRCVLRRGRRQSDTAAPAEAHHLYEFGNWRLDATAQALHDNSGRPVSLTSGEFRLLEALVTRANRVLTRDQLMDICYGNNSPAFDRSIDVCIARLRRKLQDDPRNPAVIRTVRNGGYIFAARVTRH